MLVVEIEKKLGDFALHVSFASESGATVLFGPSGAGKTGVINMIAGLLKPDRGRIAIDDEVLFDSDTQAWSYIDVTYPFSSPGTVVGMPGKDCVVASGNFWALRLTSTTLAVM